MTPSIRLLKLLTALLCLGALSQTSPAATEVPFVMWQNLGTLRNDFTGYVGMRFTVGSKPLEITAVGRFAAPGNTANHIVKFVRAEDESDVPGGAHTVIMQGSTPGQYVYRPLRAPILLEAHTTYFLVTWETRDGDSWYSSDTTLTTTHAATVHGAIYTTGLVPYFPGGGPATTYGPVSFKYTSDLSPPTVTITTPADDSFHVAPLDLPIHATVTDIVGEILRVEFFAGSEPLGQLESPPYEFVWRNSPPGTHQLQAVAWDSSGLAGASPRVTVSILTNDCCPTPVLTRGPYLQQGTPNRIVVRWRTESGATSLVRYGTNLNNLNLEAENLPLTSEHHVTLEHLQPDTTYYYSIGTREMTLSQGPDHFFVTSPAGSKPTRIWVLGDSGTANANAAAVRDAYLRFTGQRHTDLWLMLGDNAYYEGLDHQYQAAVFEMYPSILRKSVLWSTIGNHDTAHSVNPALDIPYFRIFNFPTAGEAGGVPSGTEKYYSFNYGNIHFISLDSMSSDRSTNGVMHLWLEEDLAANTKTWLIAFWHHPPYSKGSHDSDAESQLIEMRENFLPLLEAHGVDLVLSGHSHIYERSYLLHGHYGYTNEFSASMILDRGTGRPDQDGPYWKRLSGPRAHLGAVYAVAGCGGKISGRKDFHPALFVSLLQMGSLVLDVDGPRLDVSFLGSDGRVHDRFAIIKDDTDPRPFAITSTRVNDDRVTLMWTSHEGQSYVIESTTNLFTPRWDPIGPPTVADGMTASRVFTATNPAPGFYRVRYLTE